MVISEIYCLFQVEQLVISKKLFFLYQGERVVISEISCLFQGEQLVISEKLFFLYQGERMVIYEIFVSIPGGTGGDI